MSLITWCPDMCWEKTGPGKEEISTFFSGGSNLGLLYQSWCRFHIIIFLYANVFLLFFFFFVFYTAQFVEGSNSNPLEVGKLTQKMSEGHVVCLSKKTFPLGKQSDWRFIVWEVYQGLTSTGKQWKKSYMITFTYKKIFARWIPNLLTKDQIK